MEKKQEGWLWIIAKKLTAERFFYSSLSEEMEHKKMYKNNLVQTREHRDSVTGSLLEKQAFFLW